MSWLVALFSLTDTGKALLRFALTMTVFIAVVTWALVSVADTAGAINSLSSAIQNITPLVASLPSNPIFAKVNTIFPLAEFTGFLAIQFGLFGVCLVVRVARSFIPTMGG